MKKLALFFIAGLFLFTACGNEPKAPADAPDKPPVLKPDAPNTQIGELAKSEILLVCSPVDDPNQEPGYPQNEVFLYLAESKVKVADILACEAIPANQYADYQIPEKAIAAVGGWWAGSGDYIYVVEEDGNYVVKKGEQFEEQDDNSFNYKTVMTFTKKGEEVF